LQEEGYGCGHLDQENGNTSVIRRSGWMMGENLHHPMPGRVKNEQEAEKMQRIFEIVARAHPLTVSTGLR
jgi:hypothetical protein